MALKLMYITNNAEIAKTAESAGTDRIFIDLETVKKEERQKNLDTVKSHHSISDIAPVKSAISKAELLVRINPIYENSKDEIESVVKAGADIIMLPYFKHEDEVKFFLDCVKGRTKTCLLVETPESVERLDKILSLSGIDEIHIGLNDLHLGYRLKFMFQLLENGTVDKIIEKIKAKGIPYGFGGIATVGKGMVPAELIIGEHYRLGSSMAILSRSFCNVSDFTSLSDTVKAKEIESIFRKGVKEIRDYEETIKNKPCSFYEENREKTNEAIRMTVAFLETKKVTTIEIK